jgi:hypothetical protein
MAKKIIGTAPDQIPLNSYLGELAYYNADGLQSLTTESIILNTIEPLDNGTLNFNAASYVFSTTGYTGSPITAPDGTTPQIQFIGNDYESANLFVGRFELGSSGGTLSLGHSNSNTIGENSALGVGSEVGKIQFWGCDGTNDWPELGRIAVHVGDDGVASADSDMRFQLNGTTKLQVSPDRTHVGGEMWVTNDISSDSGLRIQPNMSNSNPYGFGNISASYNIFMTNEQGTTNQCMVLSDSQHDDIDGVTFGISGTTAGTASASTGEASENWAPLLELCGNGLRLPKQPAWRIRFTVPAGTRLGDVFPGSSPPGIFNPFNTSCSNLTINEQVDRGGNVSGGVFTAPVDGVYFASYFTYHLNPDMTAEVSAMTISINGSRTEELWTEIEQNPQYTVPRIQGFSAVFGLSAGDTLSVGWTAGAGGVDMEAPITIFSGHLIG